MFAERLGINAPRHKLHKSTWQFVSKVGHSFFFILFRVFSVGYFRQGFLSPSINIKILLITNIMCVMGEEGSDWVSKPGTGSDVTESCTPPCQHSSCLDAHTRGHSYRVRAHSKLQTVHLTSGLFILLVECSYRLTLMRWAFINSLVLN